MVRLSGLVPTAHFVLALLTTPGLVLLLIKMISTLGLNALTKATVIAKRVLASATLDMTVWLASAQCAPITVTIADLAGLRSI